MNPEDEAEEDGANIDLDSQRKGKCVVLKTSTRQVTKLIFLYLLDSYLMFQFFKNQYSCFYNIVLIFSSRGPQHKYNGFGVNYWPTNLLI